jgi:hypothetical protein
MTGELSVLDKTGDTKIIWDSARQDEVDAAERTFDDLKKKGYLAYSVTKKGDKDEVIKKFDRYAEKIIMAPPLVGG